jgi:hypothetical protein
LFLVLTASYAMAAVAPSGGQRVLTVTLFILAAIVAPIAHRMRRFKVLAWASATLLLCAAVGASLYPVTAGEDVTPKPSSSSAVVYPVPVSTPAIPSTPAPQPSASTRTPETSVMPVETVLLSARTGQAVEAFGGLFRIGVQSVYESYAVLNVFTQDSRCNPIFLDVGEDVRFPQISSARTFELTLMETSKADGTVKVRITSRSETNESKYVACV